MYSLQFWKSWPIVNQRIFWVLSGVAIFTLLFLWISDFYFPAPVFTPKNFRQLELVEFSSHSFHLGTLGLQVPADALLIFERTLGGPMKPNGIAAYVFLAAFIIGITSLLSVVSGLSRFWFYIGLGLLLLLILSFGLESLLLFGLANRIPSVIVFVTLGLPAYYFQFINTESSFTRRLLIFAAIVLAVGWMIFMFARVDHPFLLLAAGALIPGTILTVVFIFMAAPEILSSLIVVVSRGTRQTRTLQHFLIISAIYLVNLGLIYMSRKHLIGWNFLPVNLFLFATLSGVLGLWRFRQREPVYAEIIQANPLGVFLYLNLASVAFGTIGYFIATANDPVIQFTQDVVLYSHLGYGLIFVIYVISNFGSMLASNLQVYRVMYKPNTMPYFTFRLAGLIATFTFFAYSNWKVSADQVYAGYFNAYGDRALPLDTLLAEGYYQRSMLYAIRNYHSHYALAQIKNAKGEAEEEKNEYQKLVDSRPIDLAYLNLNRTYERDNELRNSVRVLISGLHDFPKNGRLENELGMVYAKMNMKDSAWWFVNLAKGSSVSRSEAETNLLGLEAKFKLQIPDDSLMTQWGPENSGLKSNALALACVQGKKIATSVDPGNDTLPNIYSIASLHNYLINRREQSDTTLINKTIQLGRQTPDPYFIDFLLSGAAFASYANGQTIQAIHLLRELATVGQNEKYYNVIGLWALEQNAPDRAAGYFDEALKQDFQPSYLNRAIALTESSHFVAALKAWDSLKRSPDVSVRKTALRMALVLLATPSEMMRLGDPDKYLYLRYRVGLNDDQVFEEALSTMKDSQLKAQALVDRSRKLDEADEIDRAEQTLAMTKGLNVINSELYEEIAHLNLLLLARKKNWPLLEQQMHSGITFNGKYRLDGVYLSALLNSRAGKKTLAHKQFRMLSHANPFFEDAVVSAVDSLNLNSNDKLNNYSTLVEALELNPNSIKLLKIHAVLSAELDFEENSRNSLDKLKAMMSPGSFVQFLQDNPKYFAVVTRN